MADRGCCKIGVLAWLDVNCSASRAPKGRPAVDTRRGPHRSALAALDNGDQPAFTVPQNPDACSAGPTMNHRCPGMNIGRVGVDRRGVRVGGRCDTAEHPAFVHAHGGDAVCGQPLCQTSECRGLQALRAVAVPVHRAGTGDHQNDVRTCPRRHEPCAFERSVGPGASMVSVPGAPRSPRRLRQGRVRQDSPRRSQRIDAQTGHSTPRTPRCCHWILRF